MADTAILLIDGIPVAHGEDRSELRQILIDMRGPFVAGPWCEAVEDERALASWLDVHAGIEWPVADFEDVQGNPVDWEILTDTWYIFELDSDEAAAVEEYCAEHGIEIEGEQDL